LQNGDNFLLFLPLPKSYGRRVPWIEFSQHNLLGFDDKVKNWLGLEDWPEDVFRTYSCNTERCLLCEWVTRLGKSKSSVEKNLSRKWYAGKRYMANVVTTKQSTSGVISTVKPFIFGKKIKEALLSALVKDRMFFHNPEALMIVRIKKKGEGLTTEYKTVVMDKIVNKRGERTEKRVRMDQEWLGAMRDLYALLAPSVDSQEEFNEIVDMLFEHRPSADKSGSRASSASSSSHGFSGGGNVHDDDDLPF
jgi:hypothetical protein